MSDSPQVLLELQPEQNVLNRNYFIPSESTAVRINLKQATDALFTILKADDKAETILSQIYRIPESDARNVLRTNKSLKLFLQSRKAPLWQLLMDPRPDSKVGSYLKSKISRIVQRFSKNRKLKISKLVPQVDVTCMVWSPDGKLMISGSKDGTLQISTKVGQVVAQFSHQSPVNTVSCSPDGKHVVVGTDDGTVLVRHIATGKVVNHSLHADKVTSVSWSPDGDHIAIGLEFPSDLLEDSARMGSTKGPDIVQKYKDEQARLVPTITQITISYNIKKKRRLSPLVVWNIKTNRIHAIDHTEHINKSLFLNDGIRSVAWSPDGRRLASVSSGFPHIWDIGPSLINDKIRKIKRLVLDKESQRDYCKAVVWSPDGTEIASAEELQVRIWNAITGKLRRTLIVPEYVYNTCYREYAHKPFDKDEAKVIRKTVNSINKKECRDNSTHYGLSPVTSLSWSSKGDLAVGYESYNVRIWKHPIKSNADLCNMDRNYFRHSIFDFITLGSVQEDVISRIELGNRVVDEWPPASPLPPHKARDIVDAMMSKVGGSVAWAPNGKMLLTSASRPFIGPNLEDIGLYVNEWSDTFDGLSPNGLDEGLRIWKIMDEEHRVGDLVSDALFMPYVPPDKMIIEWIYETTSVRGNPLTLYGVVSEYNFRIEDDASKNKYEDPRLGAERAVAMMSIFTKGHIRVDNSLYIDPTNVNNISVTESTYSGIYRFIEFCSKMADACERCFNRHIKNIGNYVQNEGVDSLDSEDRETWGILHEVAHRKRGDIDHVRWTDLNLEERDMWKRTHIYGPCFELLKMMLRVNGGVVAKDRIAVLARAILIVVLNAKYARMPTCLFWTECDLQSVRTRSQIAKQIVHAIEADGTYMSSKGSFLTILKYAKQWSNHHLLLASMIQDILAREYPELNSFERRRSKDIIKIKR